MDIDKAIDYFLGDPQFVAALDAGDEPRAFRYMRQCLKTAKHEDVEAATHLAHLRRIAKLAGDKLTRLEYAKH